MKTRLLLAGIASAGIALLAASSLPRTPLFVWNFTASAPVGLYRTMPGSAIMRGAWVAVAPTAPTREILERFGVLKPDQLLVKLVAAVAGDEVCRHGFAVTINGVERAIARSTTSSGIALPSWSGCRTLAQGEVFLLGQTQGSFDGRYFGVTSADEIVAPLAPLVTRRPSP